MIKQIIKALNENKEVTSWQISDITSETVEQFYVLQNLETTRKTKVEEATVTIYHAEGDTIGSANFLVSHKLKKSEIDELISDALYAARFAKNPKYDLVDGPLKKTFKADKTNLDPYEVLTKCADIFFAESKENAKFNSLELFYETKNVHFINSNGVDLKKNLFELSIESVPSFNGSEKVEIYRMFHYTNIDFDKIQADAAEAISDVTYRSAATKPVDISKADCILRSYDAFELFENLISNLGYPSIYRKQATKEIGEMIQPVIKGDALTIKAAPNSKANAFDNDGVIIKTSPIIENGKFVASYGSNQYAKYLGVEPTGTPGRLVVNKGKLDIEKLSKKPYIEIITLSGIQVDIFAGYVGGEVRLALYHDGANVTPLSGFSFSGNIDKVLETIKLSKETVVDRRYTGPKYTLLENMDIL